MKNDITDASLQSLVGDPLLKELDKVSVKPIEAVQDLAASEYTIICSSLIYCEHNGQTQFIHVK